MPYRSLCNTNVGEEELLYDFDYNYKQISRENNIDEINTIDALIKLLTSKENNSLLANIFHECRPSKKNYAKEALAKTIGIDSDRDEHLLEKIINDSSAKKQLIKQYQEKTMTTLCSSLITIKTM